MSERYPEVTTIQGAINSGAARLVSSFSAGFQRQFGYLPPWQKVENYVKVVFPGLKVNQRSRVREYGMAAAAAGRAFVKAAPGSRAFESVAPNFRTRGTRTKATVAIPVMSRPVRGRRRQRIGLVPVTVYVKANATREEILREATKRAGSPQQWTYQDPYHRPLRGFRDPEYGEPVVSSLEKVN